MSFCRIADRRRFKSVAASQVLTNSELTMRWVRNTQSLESMNAERPTQRE
jgi:hypothetical protein